MSSIKIISLGSGVPDNITLRAFTALKESDIIFAPSGEAVRVLERLKPLEDLLLKVEQFDIPMKKDPSLAVGVYDKVTQRLYDLYMKEQQVSLVTIGDAGIYSSAFKIVAELTKRGAKVEVLPGVPSFVAGMAQAMVPLVEQGQNLTLLSQINTPSDVLTPLANGSVVAIMKLSLYQESIKELLRQGNYPFTYMEWLGDEKQFLTSDLESFLSRTCPYFSIIVIKPQSV